jgi:hypothetical protein
MNLKLICKIVALFIFSWALFGLVERDFVVTADDHNEKIEDALTDQLDTTGSVDFIIRFTQQADLSPAESMDWEARGEFVYRTLLDTAESSQAQTKVMLDSQGLAYQTFIAGNDLYVFADNQTRNAKLTASQEVVLLDQLAALPEVGTIRATRTYTIEPDIENLSLNSISWSGDLITHNQFATVSESPDAVTDWGITDTKADQAWALGARGSGIKVANIDTGVQWDHPALVDQFACPGDPSNPDCWKDPSNICPSNSACDNNGHGTHTMGTMVAKDDPSLTYIAGMAPDATWIACKGCESSSCTDYALNSCADWVLAPGGDPANRPNVVNNSWGDVGGNSWYESKVVAWVAAGIFPAFSSGNSTGCSSTGSPGDYQESFSSTGHNSARAHVFSQGPSFFGHEPYTKPNITAPAASICSTVPTNTWSCGYSGTSMASPHSAGAVAQIWSVCPAYIGDIYQTFELLQDFADPPDPSNPVCGAPPDGEGTYEDGYGYLNVLDAVAECSGSLEHGALDGYVRDLGGNPIEGVKVVAQPSTLGTQTTALTDPSGYYTMTLAVRTYGVTASKENYVPETIPDVDILADDVTHQDFTLRFLYSWTQIPRDVTCPDWTRYDGEYYKGLIYFLGGRTNSSTLGDVYAYNPITDTCTDTGTDMTVPVSNYTVSLVNDGSADLLCIFGGRDASGAPTLMVQCYDPVANQAMIEGDLPAAYTGFTPGAQVVVNNKVYIFGGFNGNAAPYELARTDRYDPVTNLYTQIGDLSLGRSYIDAAVVDGKIYALGGTVYDGANLNATARTEVMADPEGAGTWNDAAVVELPTATAEGRAYGFDTSSPYELAGKIIIAGGGQWPEQTNEVFSYDVASDSYDYNFADLSNARRDQAGVFVPGNPGTMWVFGGRQGSDAAPYMPPEYFQVNRSDVYLPIVLRK